MKINEGKALTVAGALVASVSALITEGLVHGTVLHVLAGVVAAGTAFLAAIPVNKSNDGASK